MRIRRFTNTLGNQNGFSAVEAILAGGLGVLLIGGFLGGLAAMSSVQKSVDVASDAKSLAIQISENLKAGESCQATLLGKVINVTNADPVNFSINTQLGDSVETIAAGATPMAGVTIKKFDLITNTAIAPIEVPSELAGVSLFERIAVLRLEVQKEVNGVPQTMEPTDIPMKLLTDASGTIKFCNSGVNAALVCAQQGGTYDAVTSTCAPANHCEFGGSYGDSISDSYGRLVGGYSNELTGTRSCPVGFSSVRSGSSTISRACGKTCVENAYAATFSCVRCGASMAIYPGVAPTGSGPSDLNPLINTEVATNQSNRDTVPVVTPPVASSGGGGSSGSGSSGGGGGGGGGSDGSEQSGGGGRGGGGGSSSQESH